MVFNTEVLTKLNEDLEPSAVMKRQGGGGKELSYLSGHYVDSELIRVFGYGNVSTDVVQHPIEVRPGLFQAVVRTEIYQTNPDNERVLVCSLTDVGYGTHTVAVQEKYSIKDLQEIEKAGKESVTDARKRSLVSLGNRFGLCLYDKNDPIHNAAGSSAPSRPATRSSSTSSSTPTRTTTSRNPIDPSQYPPSNDGSGGWQCDLCGTPIRDSKNGQWKAGELATMSARSNNGQIRCYPCKDK